MRRLRHALTAAALTTAVVLGSTAFTTSTGDTPGDTAWTEPADTAWNVLDTVTGSVNDLLAHLRDTAW